MGLTWRDAVSSLALGVIFTAYGAYLSGSSLLLISSAWATTSVVLVLGIGCAVIAAGDLYTRPQPHPAQIVRRVETGICIVALGAGATGLIDDSGYALRILVAAMIALWGTATFWHVLTIGSEQ